MGTADILDYGCGKGNLAAVLTEMSVRGYDPAVVEFAAEPQPADIVVCTDVLEHIEPDCVDAVLAHIASLTKSAALLAIACYPAIKKLADGRNAHLSVHPPRWWGRKLAKHMAIAWSTMRGATLVMICKPKTGADLEPEKKPEPGMTIMPDIAVASVAQQCTTRGALPSNALTNSATQAMIEGEYGMAAQLLRRALDIDPINRVALDNLATVMKYLGREEEAIAIYRRLIAMFPEYLNARNSFARSLLRIGQYAEGWQNYRFRLVARRRTMLIREPLQGRPIDELKDPVPEEISSRGLFLAAEQGIGDELFFLRFLPRLYKMLQPPKVWYWCSPKLQPIMRRSGWPMIVLNDDQTRELDRDTPILPLCDLARFTKHASIEEIPGVMSLDPRPHGWRWGDWRAPRPFRRRTIGVTWRAGIEGTRHRGGLFKEIDPAALGRALSPVRADIVVLQRNLDPAHYSAFCAALGRPAAIAFEGEKFSDRLEIEYLMRLLADLSDYVGVSNTNTYLLAAMGKTARVLCQFPYEWRWMVDGDTTPWMPGFQCYRERIEPYGWTAALEKLTADLSK